MENNVAYYRKRFGMSQQELAVRMGVTQGAVSQWECGRTSPNYEQLVYMSKLFEVPLTAIMGSTTGEGSTDIIFRIRNAITTNPDLSALFDAVCNVKEENMMVALKILEALS